MVECNPGHTVERSSSDGDGRVQDWPLPPIEVALFNVEHSLWPTLDKRPNLPIGSQSPATSSGLGAIFGPHQLHAVHTSAGQRSTQYALHGPCLVPRCK